MRWHLDVVFGYTVHVGLTIDTTDTDADQIDTQLIVNADSEVEGETAESLSPEDNASSSNPSSPTNNGGRFDNGDDSSKNLS